MDLRKVASELQPVLEPLRVITPTGRSVALAGLAAWVGASVFGWAELQLIAGGCLIAVLAALLLTMGRTSLISELVLRTPRVKVGETAGADVKIVNAGKRRTFGLRLAVPVGHGEARFNVPPLPPGEDWSGDFVIPTTRRCVLTVGPVRSVREDPLGLVRRGVSWSDEQTLFVHPRVIRLPALTSGWLRDLEGKPTTDLSPSDVAFHTLREYVPGDDRRHIHWKSTAKNRARPTKGTGLLVRQFNDTRRSHLGLILSTNVNDYGTDDDFELAVSIVGSLGATALFEDQTVSTTTGRRPIKAKHPTQLLDALAGVETSAEDGTIHELARHSVPLVRGAGVIVVVSGSNVAPIELRRASETFHHDVRVMGVIARVGADTTLQRTGTSTIVELGDLDDLPRVLRATVSR